MEHELEWSLRPDEALLPRQVAPPIIELDSARAGVLSGVVRDEVGVASLLVYRDGDKVAVLRGEEGGGDVPFSVDLPVGPEPGLLTLLARDSEGLVSTVTLLVPSERLEAEWRARRDRRSGRRRTQPAELSGAGGSEAP